MKIILQIEEFAMLILAVYLFTFTQYPWWLFAVLFLSPDIGMIGYLINPKVGSITYNLTHHKGIAIALYLAGIFLNVSMLQFTGILMFAHSSFDRVLGYGLKYKDAFKHTHLGNIGLEK